MNATMEHNEKQNNLEKTESIASREVKVGEFWRDNQIFEKTLANTEGNDPYVFYDGPPFATGLPHHGHLLQGTMPL